MFNIIVGAGAVRAGAGAASRYGSGYDQKMRLLAAPAPQHWFLQDEYQQRGLDDTKYRSVYHGFLVKSNI
jgi:hypothetical protein